jgi:predicted enzyme related to lactoylglutathione lyase
MPEMTTYLQGTPAWVDLWARDLESAQAFYAAVLGWDFEALPGGGYTFARLRGRPVAGMTSLGQDSSFPVTWATYLAVDDVDATTKTAEAEARPW